ncbi:hypothetical protein [Streptomyces sp. NPDC020917]|uniref:hypothetical protein n=1 Tax=Streptomyces sp. NPDC020917 TaxID=3365102 RepID=UPI0037B73298
MSAAAILSVVVAVLVVAAAVVALTVMRGGTGLGGVRLKHRFGPEYERALAHHDGDEKATRHELSQRVKRYARLEIRPLAAQDAERFEARWAALKAQFVDSPTEAVAEADGLIGRLAERRGFPGQESPEHNDALSVHHPHQLHGYRQAHALTGEPGTAGPKATEELRQALVAAREMFEALLGGPPAPAAGPAPEEIPAAASRPAPAAGENAHADALAPATAHAGTADEPKPKAAAGGKLRRSPLGHRLAALTGSAAREDGTGSAH